MPSTFHIRDIPDEIAAAVDAAATAAGSRSREAFLRDYLKRTFGEEGSDVGAMAARARQVVSLFETLGNVGVLKPAPTVPGIARAIGHPDASLLEAELRGDRPLSFSDGDQLCELFGLEREWLESGGQDAPRFSTSPRYPDCSTLQHALLADGVSYEQLFFVLAEEADTGAIIGHTSGDNDPKLGWRYDLLVNDIPIHDRVGGTGRAQRREFADLMVTLYDDSAFPDPVGCVGRIVPRAYFMAMANGYVHPATVTSTYAPGTASPVARRSDWHEDFWSFDRREPYTRGYAEGRAALLEELRASGVSSDEQYRALIRKEIRPRKIRRRHPF
jgi:plasmid stability protein